jgi:hypothetical protein
MHTMISDPLPATVHPCLRPSQVCDSINGGGLGGSIFEVVRAGGVGVIFGYTPADAASGLNFPREYTTSIPFVMVQPEERQTVIDFSRATRKPYASFSAPQVSFEGNAPQMALFSSRGPTPTLNQVVLKPDITAPGVFGRPMVVSSTLLGLSSHLGNSSNTSGGAASAAEPEGCCRRGRWHACDKVV